MYRVDINTILMQTILIRWWNINSTNVNKDDLPVNFALVNQSDVGMAYARLRSYVDSFENAKYWVNPDGTKTVVPVHMYQEGSRLCWWNGVADIDSAECDTTTLEFVPKKLLRIVPGIKLFKTLPNLDQSQCAFVGDLPLY